VNQFNALPDLIRNQTSYKMGDREIICYELSATDTAIILNRYVGFVKQMVEDGMPTVDDEASQVRFLKSLAEDIETYYDLVAFGTNASKNEIVNALHKKITLTQLFELALKVIEVNKENFLSSMKTLPMVHAAMDMTGTEESRPRKKKTKARQKAGRV